LRCCPNYSHQFATQLDAVPEKMPKICPEQYEQEIQN
jgi:hypothetical protein